MCTITKFLEVDLLMSTKPTDNGAQLQIDFARVLEKQLDEIDFPSGAQRANAFSAEFGVLLAQAYKIIKGLTSPGISVLVRLRRAGVSIDEILNQIGGNRPPVVKLNLAGETVLASARITSRKNASNLIMVPGVKTGTFDLQAVTFGMKLPQQANYVSGLTFQKRALVAVIEDHPVELDLLARGVDAVFDSKQFSTANALFQQDIDIFDVFLLDWNLPDMKGPEVIAKIREHSAAPIFILTGDDDASEEIATQLELRDVHHAAKPTPIAVLNKRMLNALNGL